MLMVLPVVLGIVTLVFVLLRIVPGDPVRLMVGLDVDTETVERMRSELGLDRPLTVQYKEYIVDMVKGDWGESLRTKRPVMGEVTRHFFNTLKLAAFSIVIATALGLVLGTTAAYFRNTLLDRATLGLSILGISVPSYFLGLLLMLAFAVQLNWLPSGGGGTVAHLVLPALTLAGASTALITRMVRSSVVDVLQQDYIRTARAKGLSEGRTTIFHGVRNALLPAVTVISLEFGWMLGGAVLVETIFSYPGIGWLLVTTIGARDFPIVQGAVVLVAVSFVVINLLTDVSYAYLDPRIRY